MPVPTPSSDAAAPPGADFRTTHWSVVLSVRDNEAAGQRALAELCQTYWYPLYAFVRRRGFGPEDAQDLTQEFFARMIERASFQSVDRERGKFRSFLLACLKNFLANEWTHANRQKRGGGQKVLSLDAAEAEDRYKVEPADASTPETIYEQTWAATLLERVMARLRKEYVTNEKGELFDELKDFLCGDKTAPTYAEIGARHGISEGAVKMAALRLRQRYAALLRAEIAHTVASPDGVENEIRCLIAALSR
jgi:RNA polymerase sigma factor (sigma-70 family)